jgi:hypothetical protein
MSNIPSNREAALKESTTVYGLAEAGSGEGDIDISLLEESLRMAPWDRMLANDDALNFAESLRAAMERRNAKPK